MGFFDRFTETLSDWNANWSAAGENLKSAYQSAVDASTAWAAVVSNLLGTHYSDDEKENSSAFKVAWDGIARVGQGGAQAVGGVFGAAAEMPVLRQAFGFAEAAQDELVRRPLATGYLMAADAMFERDPNLLGDIEAWKDAYNTTTYVTPGQAALYAAGANVHMGQLWVPGAKEFADQRQRDLLRTFPNVGILAQDPRFYDPRNRNVGRKQYYENSFMQGVSGTLDAGVVILADPTVVLGKAAMAAKLRYISQPMHAAAIQAGRLEAHIDSASYRKTKDFIYDKAAKGESSEAVWRQLFANHYDGELAAALLYDAARHQSTFERLGGQVDLYDTTFRALYGDEGAWGTLAREAPRIADAIGSRRANDTLQNTARNYGTGDVVADARWDKAAETKMQAFVNGIITRTGVWGELGETTGAGGLLTGQTLPKVRATSKWRAGTHVLFRNKLPTKLGHWARRGQYLLPSQRAGRMLDVNDPNSVGVFRSTFARSRMDVHEIDRWVSAYSRATSPARRFEIATQAEDYAYRKHAKRYGLSEDELNAAITLINTFRRGNRQIMSNTRRFASADVQRVYEQYLAEGRLGQAHQLAELRANIDDAVARGDMPEAYYRLPDEDGNLTLIPEDSARRIDSPITGSQYAEMMPMVDWHVLDNALWFHAGFGYGKPGRRSQALRRVGEGVYSAQDMMRASLEAVMSVWKITSILRPGYIWRTLSDELARVMVKQANWGNLMSMGKTRKFVQANMMARGRLLGEIANSHLYRAKAQGVQRLEIDAETIVAGKPLRLDPEPTMMSPDARFGLDDLPIRKGVLRRYSPEGTQTASGDGSGLIYRSYEHAFGDGLFGVDDLIAVIDLHGRAGTLPAPLHEAWNSRTEGQLTERQYRNQVLNYTLRRVNRGAFTNPVWQRNLVRQVRRAKEAGEISLIDPLSGMSPGQMTRSRIDAEYVTVGEPVTIGREHSRLDEDDLYDFIADNFDEISKPNALLSAELMPDRRGVQLTVRRSVLADAQPVKPTGGYRIKWPFSKRKGDLVAMSGQMDLRFKTSAGDVDISGAFLGDDGDRFRNQTTSRGPQDSWVDTVTDTEFARFKGYSGRYDEMTAERGQAYDVAWERAVNAQLGNDEVAKRFMLGWDVDSVINWLHNTKAGNAYLKHMGGAWTSQYAANVLAIQAMVDTYLPVVEGRVSEAASLRRKAAQGEATIKDLEAFVARRDMPRVHGADLEAGTGRGWFMDRVKRATDKAFRYLSDVPSDKFVRYPFAAERYAEHVNTIVQRRGDELARQGRDMFSVDDVAAVEKLARRRALRDVQRYLFNTNATWDLAKATRLFVPFGSAIADSGLKWGLVLRENPTALLHLWKIWNAPDRNGLVQDEDGNQLVLEDGKEVWYKVHPVTGEREALEDHTPKQKMIVFRLPSFMRPDELGEDSTPITRINKQVFRTFLDHPSFGPIVAVPANRFALENPEFGENRFVRQFLLPTGPTANDSSMILPANVRNIRAEVIPDFFEEDRQYTESQTISIFAADMVDYSLGQRPNAPTFEEAREKANAMRGLRFWSRLMGISPQFVSPYQPYVDYYHQLRLREVELRERAVSEGRDPGEVPAADELFYREMGTEYFALTAAVTRNAAGIPATVESHHARKKYQDLVEKHPDIASLIIGREGAGVFARTVYEGQKLTETRPGSGEMMRERMSPEESWQDVQRRQGWLEYGKYMDLVHVEMSRLGVTSLQQSAAERIKNARDAWIEQRMFVTSPWGETTLNPWYDDFRSIDGAKMTGRLHSMREIIKDPRLQGRDDIRGLIDYLSYRDRFKAYMQNVGYSSLATDEAESARYQWQRVVWQLKNDNAAFAALHDRWLTADEDLTADG